MARAAGAAPQLLSAEEYGLAQNSNKNARYTGDAVVDPIWATLQRMGAKPGMNWLEPALSVGVFFGQPAKLVQGARRIGVEKESITAQIAKLLYPDSGIGQSPFEKMDLPRDYFDGTICR
jgi:hypothetical protein